MRFATSASLIATLILTAGVAQAQEVGVPLIEADFAWVRSDTDKTATMDVYIDPAGGTLTQWVEGKGTFTMEVECASVRVNAAGDYEAFFAGIVVWADGTLTSRIGTWRYNQVRDGGIGIANDQYVGKAASYFDPDWDMCEGVANHFWLDLTDLDLANGTGDIVILHDRDFDGVVDEVDNCPDRDNPLQEDLDLDGAGDVCDLDDDDDGVADADDNCPVDANSDQSDLDNDAVGDACDSTFDQGGAADYVEILGADSVVELTNLPKQVPGVNGLVVVLIGNGSVSAKVADAVAIYPSDGDFGDYLGKLGAASNQLASYASRIEGLIAKGKLDATAGATLLVAAAEMAAVIDALANAL